MPAGEFPALPAYPIKARLEIDGINVVLLGVPPNEDFPQNLYGLNDKGDVIWQIEPRPSVSANNKYTSIRDEIGVIVAQTEDRCQRKIDAKTGRVLNEEQAPET